MAWIGPPGRLIEFKCPSSLDVSEGSARVFFTSMGGRVSMTDLSAGVLPRVWEVQVDTARPQDVNNLLALSSGEWGPGPFHWVPPGAEATNLLSKASSLCMGTHWQPSGVTAGGPVSTSEGWAGQSLLRNGASQVVLGHAPAKAGTAVTVRAWCVGAGARLQIVARDSAGGSLTSPTSTPLEGPSGWVTYTMTYPPTGVVDVQVNLLDGAAVTRPSVTWGSTPHQWAPGAASLSATIQPVPTDLIRATGKAGEETLSRHQFQVQEVSA